LSTRKTIKTKKEKTTTNNLEGPKVRKGALRNFGKKIEERSYCTITRRGILREERQHSTKKMM